jgi:transcriptional regulator with XRE-family HTH domain
MYNPNMVWMHTVDIKNELEKRRNDRTWQVVAEEIGCAVSHLSEVLHGKRTPGPKVCKYLGIARKVVYVKAVPA